MTASLSESAMHVFKALPEGTRVELIGNELFFMSPSPRASHQKVLGGLFIRISNFVEDNDLGEVFVAPFDVYLDELFNAVQPDIIFTSHRQRSILYEDGIHGSPDMVIEVLSPGNARHDMVRKKELYERFGIAEYWVVDPKTKIAQGFSLRNGLYASLAARRASIYSEVLDQEFVF